MNTEETGKRVYEPSDLGYTKQGGIAKGCLWGSILSVIPWSIFIYIINKIF